MAEYEFDTRENDVIADTGKRARSWGVVSGVVGALMALLTLVGVAFLDKVPAEVRGLFSAAVFAIFLPLAVVHVAMAFLYLQAGASLQEVVDSKGRDVSLLMSALDKLTSAFRIEVLVTVAAFVLGLVAGIGKVAP